MINASSLGLSRLKLNCNKSFLGTYKYKPYTFEGFCRYKKDTVIISQRVNENTGWYKQWRNKKIKVKIETLLKYLKDDSLENGLQIALALPNVKRYKSLTYNVGFLANTVKVGCQNVSKESAIDLANDILKHFGEK